MKQNVGFLNRTKFLFCLSFISFCLSLISCFLPPKECTEGDLKKWQAEAVESAKLLASNLHLQNADIQCSYLYEYIEYCLRPKCFIAYDSGELKQRVVFEVYCSDKGCI